MHFLEFKKKFALHGKETIVASSERKSSKIVSFEKTVIDARMYYVFDREFSDIIRLSRKYLVTREFIGIPKISRGSNFASFRSSIRTNSKCWQTIVRPFNIGWYRFPVMLLFLEETRNIETFFQERISQVSPKRIMRYVNINIGEARKT